MLLDSDNLNPASRIGYQWTKNGTQTQIQVGADPKVLSFSPLSLSDAGQYTCQATVSSPYLNHNVIVMGSHDVGIQSEFSYNNKVSIVSRELIRS